MRLGKVALVGAGPGDPRLITVHGLALLRAADVVVYDRLVDRRLLDEAPDARHIFAGKAHGDHALDQDAINALLVMHARCGRRVVRLKGGDPFVFGRGGEEAEALARAGVPFEIVPGVSAAVAVPARAGIPLTHRGVAASFAVVTGHEACDKTAAAVDWAAVATATDTLVVLMGLRELPRIAARLRAAGRPPSTPVAVVSEGTTARERTVVGRLDDIATRVEAAGLTSPAVIVIGEVVRLRDRLRARGGYRAAARLRRGVVSVGGIEERHGSAGALPSEKGGLGGPSRPPISIDQPKGLRHVKAPGPRISNGMCLAE